MIVGIPKGLLYYKYHTFIETFFSELNINTITSPETNKEILNIGTKYCVDEACLPIKIFHGHVASIKDSCDLLIIPRIMQIADNEFICPKFCGIPEMIVNSIPNLPQITTMPLYINDKKKLYSWTKSIGLKATKNIFKIKNAFNTALKEQEKVAIGIKDASYRMNIALLGHPYNIYDNFANMNIVNKLHNLGVGILTDDCVDKNFIEKESSVLFKKPFWTLAKNIYGSSMYLAKNNKIDGIIYLSSFACGIDSIFIELIKNKIANFPFLVLKLDEQTGEAGFNTRIEAFIDMLERRNNLENNFSPHGEHVHSS